MTAFQIVSVGPNKTFIPLPQFGTFNDGKVASDQIKTLIGLMPHAKLQIRPVALEEDWRAREQGRFDDGTYSPLPWADKVTLIPDHFAHVSKKDPNKVAFIESETRGKEDRQKVLPVNRYLVDFYPDINQYDRKILCAAHMGREPDGDLMFARTGDEMLDVYLDEYHISSCMSHDRDYYADGHPIPMYAAGDLQIAYTKDDDDHITARAVVWPEKKIYSRIYAGNDDAETTFVMLLQDNGYLYDNLGFQGARLLKEWGEGSFEDEDCEGWLCPFLDMGGGGYVRVDPDFLVIDSKGSHRCSASGLTYDYEISRRNWTWDDNRGRDVTLDEALEFGLVCCITGQRVNPGTTLSDGRKVSNTFVSTHTFVCPHTGERHLRREGILLNDVLVSPNYKEQSA